MTPRVRADEAVEELRRAVLDLLSSNPQGMTNVDVAKALGLYSPPGKPQRNQVTWWLLRELAETGRIEISTDPRPLYKLK